MNCCGGVPAELAAEPTAVPHNDVPYNPPFGGRDPKVRVHHNVPTAYPDVEIEHADDPSKRIRFGSLWEDKPVAVAFLRRCVDSFVRCTALRAMPLSL
jgi:hypothetical protein